MKQYQSIAGTGPYRLTWFKGQLIGVEVWHGEGQHHVHLVNKYRPPSRALAWIASRRLPWRRRK